MTMLTMRLALIARVLVRLDHVASFKIPGFRNSLRNCRTSSADGPPYLSGW
jgi:hypothetical protein